MTHHKYGANGDPLPTLSVMDAKAGFRLWGMVNGLKSLIENAEKERANRVAPVYSVGIEPTLVCAFHGFRLAVSAMRIGGDFPYADMKSIIHAVPKDWRDHLRAIFKDAVDNISDTLLLLDTTPKAMSRDYAIELHDSRFTSHLEAAKFALTIIEEVSDVFSGQYLAGQIRDQLTSMVEEDKTCEICEANSGTTDEEDTYICPTCMFLAVSEMKRLRLANK